MDAEHGSVTDREFVPESARVPHAEETPDSAKAQPPVPPHKAPHAESHTETDHPRTAADMHAPKRFSALNINQRFLQKAIENTKSAPAAKTPAAAPAPRMTTLPSRTAPSTAGAGAQLAQINQAMTAAAAATSEGTADAPEDSRNGSWRSPRLVTAMPNRNQSPQSAMPADTKVRAAPGHAETQHAPGRTPWARVPNMSNMPTVSSQDFPTAAEAAAAQREAEEKAAAAAAEESAKHHAASNEHDRFRGTELPQNIHWDELEDEDGMDDVIDFGDGQQYRVSEMEQQNKAQRMQNSEPPRAPPRSAWGNPWSGRHFSDAPPAITRSEPKVASAPPVSTWGPLAQRHASLAGKPAPPPQPPRPTEPKMSLPQLNAVQHSEMHTAAERARKRREEDEKAREAERERARHKAQQIEEQLREAEEKKMRERQERQRQRAEEKAAERQHQRAERERLRAEREAPSKVDTVDSWRTSTKKADKKSAPAHIPEAPVPVPVLPRESPVTVDDMPAESPPVWRQYKVQITRRSHTAHKASPQCGQTVPIADMFTREVDNTLVSRARRVHIPRSRLRRKPPLPIGADEGVALDEPRMLASLLGSIDSDPRTVGLFDHGPPRVRLPKPVQPLERLLPGNLGDSMFSAIPYQGLLQRPLGTESYAARREEAAPTFAKSFGDRRSFAPFGRPADTWGGKGPLAFSLVEPAGAADADTSHLKTVWADAHTEMPHQPKNSLKSIADDMPSTIPLSMHDLDSSAAHGAALESSKLDMFMQSPAMNSDSWPYRLSRNFDGERPYALPTDYSDFMLSDAW